MPSSLALRQMLVDVLAHGRERSTAVRREGCKVLGDAGRNRGVRYCKLIEMPRP